VFLMVRRTGYLGRDVRRVLKMTFLGRVNDKDECFRTRPIC